MKGLAYTAALLLTAAIPAAALAQGAKAQTGATQTQVAATRSHSRIDVTFSLAGFHHKLRQEYYLFTECSGPNGWDNCRRIDGPDRYHTWDRPYTGAKQLGAGFYWNKHWKTEVAEAWTDTAGQLDGRATHDRLDLYDKETIYTPSETKYVSLFHTYNVRRTSVSQLFQFRSGTRVRPYVGVAIGIDRQADGVTRHEDVWPARSEAERLSLIQRGVEYGGAIATGTDIFPMSFPPPVTSTHVHAFGRAGVKLYGWKGIFLLLEAQVGSRVAPISAGLGIDLF